MQRDANVNNILEGPVVQWWSRVYRLLHLKGDLQMIWFNGSFCSWGDHRQESWTDFSKVWNWSAQSLHTSFLCVFASTILWTYLCDGWSHLHLISGCFALAFVLLPSLQIAIPWLFHPKYIHQFTNQSVYQKYILKLPCLALYTLFVYFFCSLELPISLCCLSLKCTYSWLIEDVKIQMYTSTFQCAEKHRYFRAEKSLAYSLVPCLYVFQFTHFQENSL